MKDHQDNYWEVPYLTINPADIHRDYEPIIRINSQSGKGGAAFVLEQASGYVMPKAMQPEFGDVVKAASDAYGDELNAKQIVKLFKEEYVDFRSLQTAESAFY
jgi:2-isopropylmalate synthase